MTGSDRIGTYKNTEPSVQLDHAPHGGHGGHGWMMIVFCIPMLAIAAVLLALGVVSVGFLVFAILCTVMMAFMMRGMSHGGPSGA